MAYQIRNAEIKTVWTPEDDLGNLEVTVVSEGEFDSETGQCRQERYLRAVLLDPDGQEADRIFPPALEQTMQFQMRVEHPQLWNAEKPDCYLLRMEICTKDGQSDAELTEPVAFWRWEIRDGQTCINQRPVSLRPVALSCPAGDTEKVRDLLRFIKLSYHNTLLVRPGERFPELERDCLRYGIYLAQEGDHMDGGRLRAQTDARQGQSELLQNPDFTLQVTQSGALIENKSTFVNASDYVLHYSLTGENGSKKEGELIADVPPGTGRFLEVPFAQPEKAGAYEYSVQLCLKKETPWAAKYTPIAGTSTRIYNFYGNAD